MTRLCTRERVLACCITGLIGSSLATYAYGQGGWTPPDNCHCGPIDDCNGIPMRHSTYCPDLGYCHCVVIPDPEGTCAVAIEARCDIPAGS